MKTVALPEDFRLGSNRPILVFEYQNNNEISKHQILLNKNTFSFLQEGTKEVFFDNSACFIDNSQFLLMKSGNCLMTEKLSKNPKHFRSILLFFSNEEVLKFLRKFEFEASNNNKQYSTFSIHYDSFIKRFVESLLEISKLSNSIQEKILRTKLEEILLYLIHLKGVEVVSSLIYVNENQNQKFIETIENNKLNRLTIKELSFLSNMSVSTFKREFKKNFQCSPSKWFQDKRLEYSAYLLKKESKRPSDIFKEIGYENLSNFIYAFKSKFGVTPKEYQAN